MMLWRALLAESLKLRRTLALWLTLVGPLAVAGLALAAALSAAPGAEVGWAWLGEITISLWGLLLLPLFIALQAALLAGVESAGQHWKHLFALPIGRTTIYLAKLIVALGLIGLSCLALWGATLLAGVAAAGLRPDLQFGAPPPWQGLLRQSLGAYAAAWLVLALQLWVSLRWRSFALAIGLGMTATVLGVLLIRAEAWRGWYPWSLAPIAAELVPGDPARAALLGLAGGIVAGALGCWEFVRRDVLE